MLKRRSRRWDGKFRLINANTVSILAYFHIEIYQTFFRLIWLLSTTFHLLPRIKFQRCQWKLTIKEKRNIGYVYIINKKWLTRSDFCFEKCIIITEKSDVLRWSDQLCKQYCHLWHNNVIFCLFCSHSLCLWGNSYTLVELMSFCSRAADASYYLSMTQKRHFRWSQN